MAEEPEENGGEEGETEPEAFLKRIIGHLQEVPGTLKEVLGELKQKDEELAGASNHANCTKLRRTTVQH